MVSIGPRKLSGFVTYFSTSGHSRVLRFLKAYLANRRMKRLRLFGVLHDVLSLSQRKIIPRIAQVTNRKYRMANDEVSARDDSQLDQFDDVRVPDVT